MSQVTDLLQQKPNTIVFGSRTDIHIKFYGSHKPTYVRGFKRSGRCIYWGVGVCMLLFH